MTTLTPATDDAVCAPRLTAADHAIGADAAEVVATTLKALADPLRLRMLSAIATTADGEACVCDLAELADVSQPTVSHHLKVLRDVGVLTSQRRGTWVWYRIAPDYRGAVTTLLDRFAPAALEHQRADRPPALTGLSDVEPELVRLAGSLAERVRGTDPADALRVVRESYTALARRGGMTAHLVPLTEHFARQRLVDAAAAHAAERADGGTSAAARPPQVLFVCVANAGRSQLAAALLRHYAGDRVVVRSAGSAPTGGVHAAVAPFLAELGLEPDPADAADAAAAVAYPKPLTDDALRAADVVVTMGCGDTCPVLPGKRYEDWTVGDPALASPSGVRAIRDELDVRVRALLTDLLPDLILPR
ncbi:ArsR family transcriptional regulator [Isoptericola sp. CG 20/1183]|uniref:ArsR family transcriptional regulator n=1 Tax=Isoptericola halotolerans TaxID=300560 RepID=A0ABX5EIB0_9MICO|nr:MULTISPECIES: metalloregulator ArsR/SmtB family transcription factor [Isoptericola]PRZ04127.1 ArsR family transcriptional regulator [Isoptericola sp. CG 20/1183]PRZ10048.1 ArsR family transcriptional regulator [Isoptericola halotolerans]